jgi:hypothetical protein
MNMNNSYIENVCNPRILPSIEDCKAFTRAIERTVKPIHSKDFNNIHQKVPAVYGLFKDDQLAYIGSSRNVFGRIREHRVYKRHFRNVGYIELPESSIRLAEYRIIRTIIPSTNAAWTRPRRDFGWLPIDELAELLNTTPGEIHDVIEANELPIKKLNARIKEVVWHFSRRENKS